MTKKLYIVLLLTSITIFAKEYGNIKVDEVTKVYDGDTITVNINSYPPIVGEKLSIRINGIDTPEIRGKYNQEKSLAIEAREFVKELLKNSNSITLKHIKRGKYFRIVADVYIDNNISVADELIKANLAVVYDGGKKTKDWCEPVKK